MQNILILNFSARKNGNCAISEQVFSNALANDKLIIERINVTGLNLKGCTGCFGCNNSEFRCLIKDDLDELKNKLNNSDVICLIAPCFIFSAPARMKIIMDRIAAWALNEIEKGAKPRLGVSFSIAGAPGEWHSQQRVFPSLFLKLLNCDIVYLKTFEGIGIKGEILLYPDVLEEIKSVAGCLKLKLLGQDIQFPSDIEDKQILLCPNCRNDAFRVRARKNFICTSCGVELQTHILQRGYKTVGVNKISPPGAIEHTGYIGGKIANAFDATDEISKRLELFQNTGDFNRAPYSKKEDTAARVQIDWTREGLEEFQRVVPKGFQGFVKKAVEKQAAARGCPLITREIFLDIKKKSGN